MNLSNPLYLIREQMALRGGEFARQLAFLMRHADTENLARILAAFPEIIEQYDAIVATNGDSDGYYSAIEDASQYKIYTPCGIVRSIGSLDAAISMAAMLKVADQEHARVSTDARAKILKAHFKF